MLTDADRLAFRLKNQVLNEQVWLPKPFLNDCEWACADAIVTHKPLLADMPMVSVDVKDLEHTQLTYDQETVDKYAETGNCNGQLVFHRQDRYYVYDGRHRTLAAEKAGIESVDVYLIMMPDNVPLTVQQFAKQLRAKSDAILQYMSIDDRRRYGESY